MAKQPGDPPGTISQRGERWLAMEPPNSAGKRPSKTFATRDKAKEHLALVAARRVMAGGDTAQASEQPLRVAMDYWLTHRLMVKETTRACYRQELAPIFAHELADTPLRDVQPDVLETLLLSIPPGHHRIKIAYRFQGFFKWATANDRIVKDPWVRSSEKDKIMKRAKKRARTLPTTGQAWTVTEARALLAGIPASPFRVLTAFMLVTGVRRGEALGLEWGSVGDRCAGICRNHTLGGGKIITEETPKPDEPRNAWYGPRLAAMLESLHPDGATAYEDFVFLGREGRPFNPSGVTLQLTRIAKRLGLPRVGGTHALRRTFATALDGDKCPIVVREALLGHSGSAYAVAHPDVMRKWGERADELFLDGLI